MNWPYYLPTHLPTQYDAKLLKLQKQTSKAQTTQPASSVNSDIFRRVFYTRSALPYSASTHLLYVKCSLHCVARVFTETTECEGRVRTRSVLAEKEGAGAGETAQSCHKTSEIVKKTLL